jgi:hypothetical protein
VGGFKDIDNSLDDLPDIGSVMLTILLVFRSTRIIYSSNYKYSYGKFIIIMKRKNCNNLIFCVQLCLFCHKLYADRHWPFCLFILLHICSGVQHNISGEVKLA